jgi:hypothetical protein
MISPHSAKVLSNTARTDSLHFFTFDSDYQYHRFAHGMSFVG